MVRDWLKLRLSHRWHHILNWVVKLSQPRPALFLLHADVIQRGRPRLTLSSLVIVCNLGLRIGRNLVFYLEKLLLECLLLNRDESFVFCKIQLGRLLGGRAGELRLVWLMCRRVLVSID